MLNDRTFPWGAFIAALFITPFSADLRTEAWDSRIVALIGGLCGFTEY